MRKVIITIIIISFLILNSWRNILVNINTNLPGWYDELFIIWIYQNNIHHFTNFDFGNIYETNAIYPFKYTLSFAEHLYLPSLLILIISLFSKNIIAQYNILLVLNHLFIFLSALLLLRKILKNNFAATISAFYISFSPYFFTKLSHFQMIFFWPLLLSLYFLINFFDKGKYKLLIFSGIWAGIQFLSSVYLGIMNLAIISLIFFNGFLFNKHNFKNLAKQFLIIIISFTIISAISIVGYLLVNQEYRITRDYGEYVTYSAHLTDYIFPSREQFSLIYTSPPFQKFKNYNHHVLGEFATFAGFIPIFFAFFYLFPKIRKTDNTYSLGFSISKITSLSLMLILFGFIFSLGPRLFVNGSYAEIPLPYDLILKVFSPIGIIRAVARWHFLVILGFAFLLGLGYLKLETKFATTKIKKLVFFSAVLILIFLEFYSLKPFSSSYKDWQEDKSYIFIKDQICRDGKTKLVEYPFHYRNLNGDIAKDVNYMAQILLNSTKHQCKILSGYYGYEPPKYMAIRDEFGDGFGNNDIKIIKDLNFDYLKFNKYAVSNIEYKKLLDRNVFKDFEKVYEDPKVVILKI